MVQIAQITNTNIHSLPIFFADKISVFSREFYLFFWPVLSFMFKVLATLQRALWFSIRCEDIQCSILGLYILSCMSSPPVVHHTLYILVLLKVLKFSIRGILLCT